MFINYLTGFFVFILGLCIGSFLNCVIYRLEQKKTLKGRSFCPNCKHELLWRDLFPVFSFLFLKGKCRYCNKSISWQYPIVEILTGVIFLLILNFKFQILNQFQVLNFLNSAFLFYIASALIIIFVYDLKHYIIPDKILFPAIAVAFLLRIFNFAFGFSAPLQNYLYAVLISAGFFLIIFLISKGRAMGFGDVKLAVLMGLLLGLPDVLSALFIAFFFGAIIGVVMMLLRKKSLKSEIPFGPFLVIGAFMALLWGHQLMGWYLSFFI